MAYYVIIGTNDNVKPVVDEIQKSHQPQHIVTTGCVSASSDGALTYHWTVYGHGEQRNSDKEPTTLENALTNQIAAFNAALPDNRPANVLVIARYWKQEDLMFLKLVCDAFNNVSNGFLRSIFMDIALLGFNLDRPYDVTSRPHWRLCREAYKYFQGYTNVTCNVCYINNLNSSRATVELDHTLIARTLLSWTMSKHNFGNNINRFYAIGMAEYRYDFSQIEEFFRLSAKESLLKRKRSTTSSESVRALLDINERFDFDQPWVDGLETIVSEWSPYCATKFDYSRKPEENPYCLAAQEAEIAEPLSEILQLYANTLLEDLNKLNLEKSEIESNLAVLATKPEEERDINNLGEIQTRLSSIESEISSIQSELDSISFITSAKEIRDFIVNNPVLTSRRREELQALKDNHARMIQYLTTDKAIEQMESALGRNPGFALESKEPRKSTLENVGFNTERYTDEPVCEAPVYQETVLPERSGCMPKWIARMFNADKEPEVDIPTPKIEADEKPLNRKMQEWVGKLREAGEIRSWWDNLTNHTKSIKAAEDDCRRKMDGNNNEPGFKLNEKPNSMSLIDMAKVRNFRDKNPLFRKLLDNLEGNYFNSDTPNEDRLSEKEMIDKFVISPLKNKYADLIWNGNNPFVDENMSDDNFGQLVNHMVKQSSVFVDVERSNTQSTPQCGFLSDKPGIPTNSPAFCTKYGVGGNVGIIPYNDGNFKNTLCVIHFSGIGNVPRDINDFCPKPEHFMHDSKKDYTQTAGQITHGMNSDMEKARAIFDWLCDNISYDVTKQIHDADRCYNYNVGVCQAYCELFVHLAYKAGLISQIVSGSTKSSDNTIPEEKHSWIFVYMDNYDGIFIDPTWGAGSVKDGIFHRSQNRDEWFDVKPHALIYTHFPDEKEWTKLELDISLDHFRNLPYRKVEEVQDINTLTTDLSNLIL